MSFWCILRCFYWRIAVSVISRSSLLCFMTLYKPFNSFELQLQILFCLFSIVLGVVVVQTLQTRICIIPQNILNIHNVIIPMIDVITFDTNML